MNELDITRHLLEEGKSIAEDFVTDPRFDKARAKASKARGGPLAAVAALEGEIELQEWIVKRVDHVLSHYPLDFRGLIGFQLGTLMGGLLDAAIKKGEANDQKDSNE